MTLLLTGPPSVDVVAHTVPTDAAYAFGDLHAGDGTPMEVPVVLGGRACYQSFGEKAGRRSAEAYLAHILDSRHLSVLEHASATLYIRGVSRTLTHELVRHRHLSPSELSQRYVDMADVRFVVPPADLPLDGPRRNTWEWRAEAWHAVYSTEVAYYQDGGLAGKDARQAARAVLPGCTETRIVLTGNLRAWLEALGKRHHPAADAEMQRLAGEVLDVLHPLAPHVIPDRAGSEAAS